MNSNHDFLSAANEKTKPPVWIRLVSAAIFLIGLLWLVMAYFGHKEWRALTTKGVFTGGEVVQIFSKTTTSNDSDGSTSTSTSYYGKISYRDQERITRTFDQVLNSADRERYPVGAKLDVVFVPDTSYKSIATSVSRSSYLWPFFTGFLFFGIAGVVWGVRPGNPFSQTDQIRTSTASIDRRTQSDEPINADQEIRELLQTGKKIQAIKRAREKYGIGLKEAKNLVENFGSKR